MYVTRYYATRRVFAVSRLARCCSTSAAKPIPNDDSDTAPKFQLSAKTARDAEVSLGMGRKLTKLQRGGIGGSGAILTVAGIGGMAWMHWPLLGPNGLCAIAGTCGVGLLALAAKGELPASKGKSDKPKRLLELKLLNEQVRLKADVEALSKVGSDRKWPSQVQQVLQTSEKLAKEEARKEAEQRDKDMLVAIKSEMEAGTSAKDLLQRLRPRIFVFDFRPSMEGLGAARPQAMKAQLEFLSIAISFILSTASEHDEAVLRLTSPGGSVPPYGLAAAQLQRLREAGIRLTVCVDTVAASGGYMMACVGEHIVAAPFAMVGSIGVIAGVPNLHKVLERNDIEYTQVTSGKYKRTANVLIPNTPEGLAKFKEDADVIHDAFQRHVKHFRPDINLERVATGEVWLGAQALEKGLVDEIGTSDGYLRAKVAAGFDAIELTRAEKKKQGFAKVLEGFGGAEAVDTVFSSLGGAIRCLWLRVSGQAARVRVEAPHLHDAHGY